MQNKGLLATIVILAIVFVAVLFLKLAPTNSIPKTSSPNSKAPSTTTTIKQSQNVSKTTTVPATTTTIGNGTNSTTTLLSNNLTSNNTNQNLTTINSTRNRTVNRSTSNNKNSTTINYTNSTTTIPSIMCGPGYSCLSQPELDQLYGVGSYYNVTYLNDTGQIDAITPYFINNVTALWNVTFAFPSSSEGLALETVGQSPTSTVTKNMYSAGLLVSTGFNIKFNATNVLINGLSYSYAVTNQSNQNATIIITAYKGREFALFKSVGEYVTPAAIASDISNDLS
jgi:hypothetical protein